MRTRGSIVSLVAVVLVTLVSLKVALSIGGCSAMTGIGKDPSRAWADAATPVAEVIATEMTLYTAGNETGGNVVREWIGAVRAGDQARAAELWFADPAIGGVRGGYLAYLTADTTLDGSGGDVVREQAMRTVALVDTFMERSP